mgnify:CR=1 FL=1
MTLMWYCAHCEKVLKNISDKELKELADEISDLSLYAPIHEPIHKFKPNYFASLLKDKKYKYITAEKDNHFTIKNIERKQTPMFLMAVLVYAVNRLSGNQIEDREGFEYLRLGIALGGKKCLTKNQPSGLFSSLKSSIKKWMKTLSKLKMS